MLQDREQDEVAVDSSIEQVFNNLDVWSDSKLETWKNALSSLTTTTIDKNEEESVPVVVVFDEACGLLGDKNTDNSLLLGMTRTSLADIYTDAPLNVQMFGLFMDTSSKTAISLHLSLTTRRLGQTKESRCSTHNVCFLALKMFDTRTINIG